VREGCCWFGGNAMRMHGFLFRFGISERKEGGESAEQQMFGFLNVKCNEMKCNQ